MRIVYSVLLVLMLSGVAYADVDVDRNLYVTPPGTPNAANPTEPPDRVQIFDDQDTFLAAAGCVGIEDFEDEPTIGTPDDGGQLSITFDDFTATSDLAALKVLDAPWAGNHNTTPGGVKDLSADTDMGGVSAQVTLTFDMPILAFGLYTVDLDSYQLELTINGVPYYVGPTGDGGQAYFGIIEDVEFTVVTMQIVGGYDSHYSMDDIAYGPYGPSATQAETWSGIKAMYQ